MKRATGRCGKAVLSRSAELLFAVFAVALALIVTAAAVTAGVRWGENGTAICDASEEQIYPKACADGSGGVIATWYDKRGGSTYDIYAQRLDGDGSIHTGWPADGVAVCTAIDSQTVPEIVSDGSGGAFIAWQDSRPAANTDIYAQRLDADGGVHAGWPADGVAVCTEPDIQNQPKLITDEAGGVLVVWEDNRSGTSYDIYAMRISGAGIKLWACDSAICTDVDDQENPEIVKTFTLPAGALVAWEDDVLGSNNTNIRTRWVADSDGSTPGAVKNVCVAPDEQDEMVMVTDNSSGAVMFWTDARAGNDDIYAQRIDDDATRQWENPLVPGDYDGVPVCISTGDQNWPSAAFTMPGNAVVAWQDGRNALNSNIYGQRLNLAGVPQWATGGTAICEAPNSQSYPSVAAYDAGSAVFAWRDYRNTITEADEFAQCFASDGTAVWPDDGVALSTSSGHQTDQVIVTDPTRQPIVVWRDCRSDAGDIYAQWPTRTAANRKSIRIIIQCSKGRRRPGAPPGNLTKVERA